MNTLNPAAHAALEQDAQQLLDAVWKFNELAGPVVAEIMQLLGVPDMVGLIRRTLEIHMAQHVKEDAEAAYVKTRRLLHAVGAN